VRVDDGSNDRQTEAGTGCIARSVAATEPLEGAFEEPGRESFAFVDDLERHMAVAFDRFEPYGAGAVAKGVLDEIPKRLLEPAAVAEQREV
jgi:hypothetical protein